MAYKLFCLQRAGGYFLPSQRWKKTKKKQQSKIEVPEEKSIFVTRSGGFYHARYLLSLLPIPLVTAGLQLVHCKVLESLPALYCTQGLGLAKWLTATGLPDTVDSKWQGWLAVYHTELKSQQHTKSQPHPWPSTEMVWKYFSYIFHVAQGAERKPEHTEVLWAGQKVSEIKASRHHLAAAEELSKGICFPSMLPGMELVSIQLQLVSFTSRWQHQKEVSGQRASASLLSRQPLYQLKSSHLSLAPFEEPQMIVEHGRMHCMKQKQELQGAHCMHKNPNQISVWGGNGDEKVNAPSVLPGKSSGTCTDSWYLSSSLWAAAPSAADIQNSPKALCWCSQRLCWKADCCELWRVCLLCLLSVIVQIFGFWEVFFCCQMSTLWGEILHFGHFS